MFRRSSIVTHSRLASISAYSASSMANAQWQQPNSFFFSPQPEEQLVKVETPSDFTMKMNKQVSFCAPRYTSARGLFSFSPIRLAQAGSNGPAPPQFPFDAKFYRLDARHLREDHFWKEHGIRADETSASEKRDENGLMRSEFSASNCYVRNRVQTASDFDDSLDIGHAFFHTKRVQDPQTGEWKWEDDKDDAETRNTKIPKNIPLSWDGWRQVFSSYEAFSKAFMNTPLPAASSSSGGPGFDLIDQSIGCAPGTAETIFTQWENGGVFADVLTCLPSSASRYQPAFTAGLYFYCPGDVRPRFMVIIGADGGGVPKTLYATPVNQDPANLIWRTGETGLKFSPCGHDKNFYKYSSLAAPTPASAASVFNITIDAYYQKFPPTPWYQKPEGETSNNEQDKNKILRVFVDMKPYVNQQATADGPKYVETLDDLLHQYPHTKNFLDRAGWKKMINKGLLMQEIVEQYYPNVDNARTWKMTLANLSAHDADKANLLEKIASEAAGQGGLGRSVAEALIGSDLQRWDTKPVVIKKSILDKIESATYGVPGSLLDVTTAVQTMPDSGPEGGLNDQRIWFSGNFNKIFCFDPSGQQSPVDPAPGKVKTLTIVLAQGKGTLTFEESKSVSPIPWSRYFPDAPSSNDGSSK